MSTKENEVLIRRFFEFCSNAQGDMEKFKAEDWSSIFAPDYVIHFTYRDMSLEQLIELNVGLLSAIPDLRFTVDDIFAVDDKVVARYSMRGTFRNTYRGIAPTGKPVLMKGTSIDRFVDGKSVETWDFPDNLSLMVQFGILPDLSKM